VSQIVRRPSADRDLVAIFRWFARQAGLRVADRFLVEAEATFSRLAGMPRMGTAYEPVAPPFVDLRFFPVSRYRDYLVFYRPISDGIEVFRVLHGARDIPGILAVEFDPASDGHDATNESAIP
jgi:toxin ParE1/3/4